MRNPLRRSILRGRTAERDDHGIVAIWTAILLVVFMGMAAIAVDISRWYVEIARVQKTVDAAALAGVVYMPGSLSQATVTADGIVTANGWDLSGVTVNTEQGDRPSRLRVTMSSTVDNPFGAVIGTPQTTITRTAQADFASPVAMGSPCNLFGNEEMERGQPWAQGKEGSSDCAGTGEYWLNIAGSNTNKARGDGYASGYCTKPDDGKGIDNCDPASYQNTGGGQPFNNADYAEEGYVYIVRTKAAGQLQLEGYDIGWAATGDQCRNYPIMQGDRPTNRYVTSQAEADERYKKGSGPYCTGDSSMKQREGDESTVKTIVTVRKPGPDPWNPLAGDVVCELTLPGWDKDTPKSALEGDPADSKTDLLQRTFHRWANLTQNQPGYTTGSGCGSFIPVGANQDYSVQVRTEGGGGQNRFALRASMFGSSNTNVSIFAASRVSLFNNVEAGTSNFKVLRLDSSAAGRTLVVRFFDLGDATDPVAATVLQPDSASAGGSALNGNSPFPDCVGAGPINGDLSNCRVVTTKNTNGGRWQDIAIKIPSDYTCDADDDQAKCWVRVRLSTTSGQNDTTTWSAGLDGDPVRLVE